MLRSRRNLAIWAVALSAISALAPTDPPPGERALLGRAPEHESETLRLSRPQEPATASRALLGDLTDGNAWAAGEVIQIRPRRADGAGALLGRP